MQIYRSLFHRYRLIDGQQTEPVQRFEVTRLDNLLAFLIYAMQSPRSKIFAHRLIYGMCNMQAADCLLYVMVVSGEATQTL